MPSCSAGALRSECSVPLFSVVMNAYNSAATLPRAMESVLRQERADFELVVVDDGSTDGTAGVLAAYRDAPRVRLFRQENRGCAASRQAGIVEARGEYVVFLDSDDEAVPGWLETFSRSLESAPADVVCAGATIARARGRSESRLPADLGPGLNSIVGLFLSGTFAVRRAVLLAAGGYVAGTEPVDHTDFLHRLVRFGESCPLRCNAVLREVVVIHREDAVPYRPALVLRGALHLVEAYPGHFRRDRRAWGTLLAIAGVNAARLDRLAEARDFFRRASAVNPWDVRSRGRRLVAGIPLLAGWIWRAPEARRGCKG
jgi:glycosyltransferase involved in cell wall biosynthesis